VEISLVRDPDSFSALAGEWNRLLSRSVTDVPFLRHEFLKTWWSTRGGGEWREAELRISVARDPDGGLLGLAPLFRTRTLDDRPGLMLLGSIEISDYLDLVAPHDVLGPFVQDLLTNLDRDPPADWEVLDLYNIMETSPTLEALRSAVLHKGWTVSQTRYKPCPVAILPEDWETYLTSLEKKQRHELRRKMRRAETSPEGVGWRIIGPGQDIESAVDEFLKHMALDERKQAFLSEVMQTQIRQSALTAFEHGWLQLALLEIGGEPAAGYLNFDYNDRLWVYNSFANPKFLALSPGWVLLGHVIRWAIEHKRRELDFLRGDEQYKYQLGGRDRYVCRMTIERR